jgi:hypothetical protein
LTLNFLVFLPLLLLILQSTAFTVLYFVKWLNSTLTNRFKTRRKLSWGKKVLLTPIFVFSHIPQLQMRQHVCQDGECLRAAIQEHAPNHVFNTPMINFYYIKLWRIRLITSGRWRCVNVYSDSDVMTQRQFLEEWNPDQYRCENLKILKKKKEKKLCGRKKRWNNCAETENVTALLVPWLSTHPSKSNCRRCKVLGVEKVKVMGFTLIAHDTGCKASTNYRGPTVRKGDRAPKILHIFLLFLGSIIVCRLYKLTLSDQTPVTL